MNIIKFILNYLFFKWRKEITKILNKNVKYYINN